MKKYLLIILMIAALLTGCTEVEPGYVTTTDDSLIQIVDSDGDIIAIDPDTGAIATIEFEHHEIHEGCSYYIQSNDDDLDLDQLIDLTVITPNTASWMHMVWSVEGTAATHIFVYEDAITATPGAVLTPLNRDRNSPNNSTGIFRDNDTFTSNGTLIWEWHTGDKKIAGIGAERDELILRQNTQYLFRAQSEINDNKVSMQLDWYEHTNR